jgi:hypothetical protein
MKVTFPKGMQCPIGKTLAHYTITSQLGKGGMGEIYQAKDQKLGWDVAIKVLPEEFAKDADHIARFQREAKLLASLNPIFTRTMPEEGIQNRHSGISDARVDIQEVLTGPSGVIAQPVAVAEPRASVRKIFIWAAATLLRIVIAAAVVWNLRPTEPRRVVRFKYELPGDQTFTGSTLAEGGLAVSVDETKIAYSADNQLYLKNFNELAARPIPGTDDIPQWAAFSPDGQWILYRTSAGRQLKKIRIIGGAPAPLCELLAATGIGNRHANDTIVYGQALGIMRVSISGAAPKPLVRGGKYEQMIKPMS